MTVCQVVFTPEELGLTCPNKESSGYHCEVIGPHDKCWIGDHTIEHYLAGNWYACKAEDDND